MLCNISNELESFSYSYIKDTQVYFFVTFWLLWENTIPKATQEEKSLVYLPTPGDSLS